MNRKAQLINEIANKVHQRLLVENEVDLHDEFYARKPGELKKFLAQGAKALEDFTSKVDDYFMGLSTRVQLKKEINNVEELLTDNAPASLFFDLDEYMKEYGSSDRYELIFPNAEWFREVTDWLDKLSKEITDTNQDYEKAMQAVALVVGGLHELTSILNRRR